MESDADRLATIQAAGGVSVHGPNGAFVAIFDREYEGNDFGGPEIEGRQTVLTARSSDVSKLARDAVLNIEGSDFRLQRQMPDRPAPGWTMVVLKR